MGTQFPHKRVLIVDDNHEAADLIAQLLELHGYATATAYGGEEGIKTALEFQPDVLMLDIGMPRVDGYAVARALRERPEMDSLVLIAFTAWGDAETRAKTVAFGFDHHVVKPIPLESLLHTVSLPRRNSV